MTVKFIHLEASIYPTTMQNVPAGVEEVEKIWQFVNAVEAAAKKYLPFAPHKITITEQRNHEIRGEGD